MDDADLTNFCAEIEDSLEKDEGASTRATSAPIPRLGKRLGAPPFTAVENRKKKREKVPTLKKEQRQATDLEAKRMRSSGRGNKMGEADINTLTMEQYLVLTCENQASGVVKTEIIGNVNFEIKSKFMMELREDTFSGNKNDDAYEHVERILDIVNLFNIPGVTHDTFMLRVFPITLTGAAKRWVDRLSPGTINTWDLLKNAFIQRLSTIQNG
nr:hypothetical protein [Tanacetum cinerariifolium]